jgi:hypothetical protein
MNERCAAESFTAQRVPLDLMLLVDRSGSMGVRTGTARTKWELASGALSAFVADPKSAGLGAGLMFFPPDGPCNTDLDCGSPIPGLRGFACVERLACAGTVGPGSFPTACGLTAPLCPMNAPCIPFGRCAISGAFCPGPGIPCVGSVKDDTCLPLAKSCQFRLGPDSCRPADYDHPLVPIADLPGARGAISAALVLTVPNGGTPTGPAVQGAYDELRRRLQAQPDRRVAVVLVTDGLPTSCNSTRETVTAQIAAARMGPPAIPTYAIGVFGPADGIDGPDALAQWATAGGTGAPFVLTPTDDLGDKLLEALNKVRGAALPCEYTIPHPTTGTLDFNKVNLHYQSAAGEEDVGHVAGADRCDPLRGGWFYDIDPAAGTPARLIACPATCDRFKSDAAAQVEVRVGCKTIQIE